MSCSPLLPAPNGALWQLGIDDTGIISTTATAFNFPTQGPILRNTFTNWQLSVDNNGYLQSTQIPLSARAGVPYLVLISPSGLEFVCTIDVFGILGVQSSTAFVPTAVPTPVDVSMSIYGNPLVICPKCGNSSVTVSADLSCWCCTCSEFVLPEDTTIIVVLDE